MKGFVYRLKIVVTSTVLFGSTSIMVSMTKEAAERKIRTMPYCQRCDLSMVNLSGADLQKRRLAKSVFIGTNFANANLTGSTTNPDKVLDNVALSEQRGADFSNADFTDAHLNYCTFQGSKFNGAKFIKADLESADLSESSCVGADFTGADLTEATLEDANFNKSNFKGATLKKVQARMAKFDDADLTGADFTGADLTGVNLSRVRGIAGAKFTNANLRKGILPANLPDVTFSNTTMPDGTKK